MIVLYIPFIHVGDLLATAESWKERSGKSIEIIKHGDDIDYELLEGKELCIYVLSHGIDDKENHAFDLANNSRRDDSLKIISIREIATRFNSDFACIHSDVKKVKLYFCNNKGNEKEIANLFVNELVLFDEVRISCYKGTIFSPNSTGHKKAKIRGKEIPAHQAQKTEYVCSSPIKSQNQRPRSPIKFYPRANFVSSDNQSVRAIARIRTQKQQRLTSYNRSRFTQDDANINTVFQPNLI